MERLKPLARQQPTIPSHEAHEADVRRAQAVSETRRLRRLLMEGKLPKDRYLQHLRELADYIAQSVEETRYWEGDAPTRAISGERLKILPLKEENEPGPRLDILLMSYLLGSDGCYEQAQTRLLGGSVHEEKSRSIPVDGIGVYRVLNGSSDVARIKPLRRRR